ncbi:MAG: hypothetical protein JNM96_09500 [Bacteroidia bacterium]|nr:hypothetical protein [Bacteroidia bacterium]
MKYNKLKYISFIFLFGFLFSNSLNICLCNKTADSLIVKYDKQNHTHVNEDGLHSNAQVLVFEENESEQKTEIDALYFLLPFFFNSSNLNTNTTFYGSGLPFPQLSFPTIYILVSNFRI